jgi:Na+-transporting NADH:ubiquinone oxidoreductase subunit B
MKFIRNTFDKYKPLFDKGGKYEKYAPAFFGFDTFLFVPNHTTQQGSHIRDGVDLKRIMSTVILALIPVTIFGIWNIGNQHFTLMGEAFGFMDAMWYGALRFMPMLAVSYGVGLTIEFAFAVFRGHEVNEGYLVTGLLIPLIMPIDLPLWMLGIAVAFSVFVGKEAFGGTGMNVLNPALVARAFAFFAYAPYMSGDKVWVADSVADGVSGETILGTLAANNEASFSVMEMFMGYIPGSVGETSFLLVMVGALILVATGVGSWRIIVSTFAGGAVMGLIFNAFGVNALMSFPWWQQLLVGGFAFGAVFMATDPVSGAQTNKGKWIYGFLIGIFAILVRVFNGAYPEGMMMAILLMNVFAPTIDHYVIQGNIKRRQKRLKTA